MPKVLVQAWYLQPIGAKQSSLFFKGIPMALPLHELAALGTATCWAATGLIAADAVRALGPFWFNLIRQGFVALLLAGIVLVSGTAMAVSAAQLAVLALSGVIGILLGDTLNFAAVARLGPRRAGAVFALNAPMTAILGWAVLGEILPPAAGLGIVLAALGVALAILGRPRSDAHRLESLRGTLLTGLLFGLGAALGQATGSLIARPVMAAGIDPYLASLLRVGASGAMMAFLAATPLAPARPARLTRGVLVLTLATAMIGLLLGMTLFLFALQGPATGIVATLSATSPVIILPLLWLRTGQRPSLTSWLGAGLAVIGLALIFLR
jgi:drug/metabolite transporter (DMT)-like permease